MELTTLFTGRRRFTEAVVVSSNSRLAELQQVQSLPEGTSLTADFQSAGRGQSGASWHSDPGKNLLASFLFYPAFLEVRELYGLNLVAALAVRDACERFCQHDLSIKWPNDIYAGDLKLAGILTENILQGSHARQSIIGIGLNVNQADFPDALPNPVSLYRLTGKNFPVEDVYVEVANCLERRYLQLKNSGLKSLKSDFEARLYRRDRNCRYAADGREFQGVIRGIDDAGQLIIAEASGETNHYAVKQVSYL